VLHQDWTAYPRLRNRRRTAARRSREFVGPALRVHERQVNTVTYSIVNAFGWPEWKAWKRRCERRAQASCAGAASLTTHERALYVALEVCVAMGFWLNLKPPSIWKDTTTIRRAAALET